MRLPILLLALLAVTLATIPSARAASEGNDGGRSGRDGLELRLGAGLHDPASREADTANLSTMLILPRWTRDAWVPMLATGGSLSLAGRTSHAHASALWRLDLHPNLFLELGLGAAIHNGRVIQSAHRSAMGCAFAFRESVGLGYRLDARWSVIIGAEHLSNGGICRHNRGLTHLGIAAGYRF